MPPVPTPAIPTAPSQPGPGGGPNGGAYIPPAPGPYNGTPIIPVPGAPNPVLPGNEPPAPPPQPNRPAPPGAEPVPGPEAPPPPASSSAKQVACTPGGASLADLFCGQRRNVVCDPGCLMTFEDLERSIIVGRGLHGKYEEDFKAEFEQLKDLNDRQLWEQVGRDLAEKQVQRETLDQFNEWKISGNKTDRCKDFNRLQHTYNGKSRCGGPVAVCPPRGGETAEEASQRLEYIGRANNTPRPRMKVPTNVPDPRYGGRTLRQVGSDEANKERNASEANKIKYQGYQVGHAPDTTWGGDPKSPGGWVKMTPRLNQSIGGQSGAYPDGYLAYSFVPGHWDEVNMECVADTF